MSQQLTQIQPLSQPVQMPDEIATFSPEVEAEIDRHLAKYPVMRSAILPADVHCAARARLSGSAGSFLSGEAFEPCASPTSGRSRPSIR